MKTLRHCWGIMLQHYEHIFCSTFLRTRTLVRVTITITLDTIVASNTTVVFVIAFKAILTPNSMTWKEHFTMPLDSK
jgi:hypothetical protein